MTPKERFITALNCNLPDCVPMFDYMFTAARKYGHYRDIPDKMAPQPPPLRVVGVGETRRQGRRRKRAVANIP